MKRIQDFGIDTENVTMIASAISQYLLLVNNHFLNAKSSLLMGKPMQYNLIIID